MAGSDDSGGPKGPAPELAGLGVLPEFDDETFEATQIMVAQAPPEPEPEPAPKSAAPDNPLYWTEDEGTGELGVQDYGGGSKLKWALGGLGVVVVVGVVCGGLALVGALFGAWRSGVIGG